MLNLNPQQPLKVSVVTAVYNRARTLQQALNSVPQQTHPVIEHVLVDGGSSALTVADSTPDDLARCINRTLDQTHRNEHVKQGFTVAEHYSWERCYQETLSLYRQFE